MKRVCTYVPRILGSIMRAVRTIYCTIIVPGIICCTTSTWCVSIFQMAVSRRNTRTAVTWGLPELLQFIQLLHSSEPCARIHNVRTISISSVDMCHRRSIDGSRGYDIPGSGSSASVLSAQFSCIKN